MEDDLTEATYAILASLTRADLLKLLAKKGAFAERVREVWSPEAEPLRLAPDTPEASQVSRERAEIRWSAEELWNQLRPTTRERIVAEVVSLEPTQAGDVREGLELLTLNVPLAELMGYRVPKRRR